MMTKISPRDWQALSAFLDNELNNRQRDRLEKRLDKDQDLRTALEELRRTKEVLRSQPRMRAPRNFTLSPAMVGAHTRQRVMSPAFPMLRLTSVLATVFFVIIVAGDLFAGSLQPALVSRDAQSGIALGMGGGGGGGGGGAGGAPEALQEQPAAEAAEAGVAEKSIAVTPEAAAIVEEIEPPSAMLAVTATLPPPGTFDPSLAQSMNVQESTQEAIAGEQAAPVEQAQQIGEVSEEGSTAQSIPVLRIFQVVLGLLALGAGIAAFFIRRSAAP